MIRIFLLRGIEEFLELALDCVEAVIFAVLCVLVAGDAHCDLGLDRIERKWIGKKAINERLDSACLGFRELALEDVPVMLEGTLEGLDCFSQDAADRLVR